MMRNPGLPNDLWAMLDGGLWHATGCDNLSKILIDREIRPANGDRYKNSFCRCRGCVSLFDFGPTSVDIPGQFNNWRGWLGHQQNSKMAIWVKCDRTKIPDGFLLNAGDARQVWKQEQADKTFIPGVEACYEGPIPLGAVSGVLLIARNNPELFQQFGELRDEILPAIATFNDKLPNHPDDEIIKRLLAGRRRCAGGETEPNSS